MTPPTPVTMIPMPAPKKPAPVAAIFTEAEKAGITVKDLAVAAGVGRVTLQRWKSGQVDPLESYNAVRDALAKLMAKQRRRAKRRVR